MKNMDRFITLQLQSCAGEVIVMAVCGGFLALSQATGDLYMVGVSCAIAGGVAAVLLCRALKKIFYDSMFGRDAGLYLSLPVSVSTIVPGKIFTAGFLSMLVLLPAAYFAVNSLAAVRYGKYQFAAGVAQFLVNHGYHALQTPLLVIAGFLASAAGCFAMAAVVFLAVVSVEKEATNGRIRSAGGVILWIAAMGAAVLVIMGNVLPYAAVAYFDVEYAALAPLIGLIVNVAVLVLAERWSVRLMERYYQR